jgi:hypothetical protein
LLGSKYIKGTQAKFAFVSTNSICQGLQVSLLWPHIFQNNQEIFFAHHSFKWTNNAKYNAGVTCIIVGVREVAKDSKYLYDGDKARVVSNINPYLTEGSDVVVQSITHSICNVPEIVFGSMANDGGVLLLDHYERNKLLEEYPQAKSLIKPIMGSLELIRRVERYCLWISETDKEVAYSIKPIKERIERCEKVRRESNRESTRRLAEVPYQFGECRHRNAKLIIIPRVSSENRRYIPMKFIEE